MRILYVQPMYFDDKSYIGGGERFVINLARAVVSIGRQGSAGRLNADRRDVSIVSFGPQRRRIRVQAGVFIDVIPVARRVSNPLDSVSNELASFIDASDIIHIFQPFTACGETAALMSFALGKKVVLTDLGGSSSRCGLDGGMTYLADCVACISDFSALSPDLKSSNRIEVVKGPFDDFKYKLRRTVFNAERKGICFVGRLLPHKGVDVLIRALPDNLPLTVCGRPYHSDYFAFLKASASGKDVTFVTDASDVELNEIYQKSVALVLSSQYVDMYGNYYPQPELLGLVLLEAMSNGCFAICNNVGGMPEFVGHHRCGAVYDDEFKLAEILNDVRDDPDKYLLMADQQFRAEWASKEFGLESVGRQYIRIYDTL